MVLLEGGRNPSMASMLRLAGNGVNDVYSHESRHTLKEQFHAPHRLRAARGLPGHGAGHPDRVRTRQPDDGRAFYAVDTYALDGSARASTPDAAGPSAHRAQPGRHLAGGRHAATAGRAGRARVAAAAGRFAARPARRRLCTGAFVLADAGLLDGRRATTHWYWADALQQRRPQAQVEADRIYIADGRSGHPPA